MNLSNCLFISEINTLVQITDSKASLTPGKFQNLLDKNIYFSNYLFLTLFFLNRTVFNDSDKQCFRKERHCGKRENNADNQHFLNVPAFSTQKLKKKAK